MNNMYVYYQTVLTPASPPAVSLDALATAVAMSCMDDIGLRSLQVRSTTETLFVGTRKAMPVNFPFSWGITFPMASAAVRKQLQKILSILLNNPLFSA